jgi:hypothetical protein
MRAGDRSYGAWRMLVKDPPPGLSVKDELPSSLPKREELPAGDHDELDWRGREWRKQVAILPVEISARSVSLRQTPTSWSA